MFGNAIEVASLFGTLELRDTATRTLQQFDSSLDRSAANMRRIGGSLTSLGGQITAFAAPLAAGFAVATRSAMSFESAMANAGAVLGRTAADMSQVNAEILAMGTASTAGPQRVAEAYYEIVSGVANASTHMAILNQAIKTSEAGQADLTATTSALISVMNAYNLSADQASMVSDVLTRTVGLGVGSMNEFAAAIPNVTGIAAQLGISFENVGLMAAFLTTRGYSAAQATDYLRGSMIALINPNESMKDALTAIGASSGSAAIEMWGLAGTYQRLSQSMSTDQLANAVGRVEALQAVLAITGETFDGFSASFINGMNGATDAARAIQQESPAYQFQLLQSKIQATAITIGKVLLPALNKLFDRIAPILEAVTTWVSQNPELVLGIAGLATAATVAGPALMGIGSAVSLIGMVLGSPILLPLAAVTGAVLLLADVLNIDLMGGFRTVLDQAGVFFGRLEEFGGDIGKTFASMWNTDEDGSSFLSTVLEGFGMTREAAQSIADQIITTVNTLAFEVSYALGSIWEGIRPAWETLRDWFTDDLMPALSNTFENHIMPVINKFVGFLSDIWNIVGPHLERLYNWFISEGLPPILDFISGKVIPVFDTFISIIGAIWDVVGPPLKKLTDWFLNNGLPQIIAKAEAAVRAIGALFDLVGHPFETTRIPMGGSPGGGSSFDKPGVFNTSSKVGGSGTPFVNAGTAFGGLALPTRAAGGPVMGGQPYIVGERGPELFMPGRSGSIVANERMGGMTISSLTVNWSSAGGEDEFEQFVAKLERLAAGA